MEQPEYIKRYVLENGIGVIELNRPQRYNALILPMYREIGEALEFFKSHQDVKVVILRSSDLSSPFYSSGNEMSPGAPGTDLSQDEQKEILNFYFDSFITFPKILIGVINGKCYGASFTAMLHADFVYVAPQVEFVTPFVTLAMVPEGVSSLILPRRLGNLANEVLFLARPLTAQEALNSGIVNEIVPLDKLYDRALEVARKVAQLPPESLFVSKKLIKQSQTEQALQVSKSEIEELFVRFASTEFAEAVMKFMMRKKSKL